MADKRDRLRHLAAHKYIESFFGSRFIELPALKSDPSADADLLIFDHFLNHQAMFKHFSWTKHSAEKEEERKRRKEKGEWITFIYFSLSSLFLSLPWIPLFIFLSLGKKVGKMMLFCGGKRIRYQKGRNRKEERKRGRKQE